MTDVPITDVDKMPGEIINKETEENSNTPSRSARRGFVYVSMFLAWLTSLFLAKFGADGKIATMIADSMMTYVITMGVTYIVGHSVDRSEILTKIFNK